jgi:hypothetical protein
MATGYQQRGETRNATKDAADESGHLNIARSAVDPMKSLRRDMIGG